jgi:hypothetical protein
MKKSAEELHLLWFGLQDVGILQTFYSQAVIQRTIVDSPAFLETSWAEKIAVCALEISISLGPKWQSPNGSMTFHRAQKSLNFQGPIPLPLALVMDAARIKSITDGAV